MKVENAEGNFKLGDYRISNAFDEPKAAQCFNDQCANWGNLMPVSRLVGKNENPLAPLIKIGEQVQGIKHVRIDEQKEVSQIAETLANAYEKWDGQEDLGIVNVRRKVLAQNVEKAIQQIQTEEKAILEAIHFLRKEEGDYVTIACENPEPERVNHNQQITCAGFWTMKNNEWREVPFMGRTFLEALQNAVAHRKQFEGETIP